MSLKASVDEVSAPAVQLAQATMALSQIDAYVRSDRQLATNEKFNSHLNRAKKLLASAHETREPNRAQAATKKTLVERLVLRKINRQTGKQLALNHPEKALLAHRGQLIGGLILLVGGLILLIAGTGTAAFIGLILALIGALGVILGFLGSSHSSQNLMSGRVALPSCMTKGKPVFCLCSLNGLSVQRTKYR